MELLPRSVGKRASRILWEVLGVQSTMHLYVSKMSQLLTQSTMGLAQLERTCIITHHECHSPLITHHEYTHQYHTVNRRVKII